MSRLLVLQLIALMAITEVAQLPITGKEVPMGTFN